jgi:glucoamylase
VIDSTLESMTARGPSWHRYNNDGYGDPPPGGTTNQGHPWPVLSGERGMYDLVAGNTTGAQSILDAMRRFAGNVAILPEQVFEKTGDPTSSARPLIWAQGEYHEPWTANCSQAFPRYIGRPICRGRVSRARRRSGPT